MTGSQMDRPRHAARDLRAVGDDHDRGAVRVEPGQQVQDGMSRGGVEIAGGLVGQDDGWPADQGAGDGDPLAFAA
jgi:hypothetical protein